MNDWNQNMFRYYGEHPRSASVIGYNDASSSSYDCQPYLPYRSNNSFNHCYTSFMDLTKTEPDSKKLLWRSPGQFHSVSNFSDATQSSSSQRPFETAFKTAISKMKQSSLTRLGCVENKTDQNRFDSNDSYDRRCMTLQPSKTSYSENNNRETRVGYKIFRCNSAAGKTRDNIYSTSVLPFNVSEAKSDRKNNENRFESTTNTVEETDRLRKELKLDKQTDGNFLQQPNQKNQSNNKKDSQFVAVSIPVRMIGNQSEHPVEHHNKVASVVSETYISPKVSQKYNSAVPRPTPTNSMDDDQNPDTECLPSVQDIIAKVEALNKQSESKDTVMSKSLELSSNKPPPSLPKRSNSHKAIENLLSNNLVNDVSSTNQSRMSGIYKKTVQPPKTKLISNMPSDFQKLHSAFLEQKQEIKRLKKELEEKKAVIGQLETELRSYEPWR